MIGRPACDADRALNKQVRAPSVNTAHHLRVQTFTYPEPRVNHRPGLCFIPSPQKSYIQMCINCALLLTRTVEVENLQNRHAERGGLEHNLKLGQCDGASTLAFAK